MGVGGAGCNAVASSSFESVSICTAAEHFKRLRTSRRVLLRSEELLFMRDTPVQTLASIDYEWKDRVAEEIGEADMIFVFTGLGGETGSFVTPVVSQICRKLSKMVIASVALPFSVEGIQRKRVALGSLAHAVRTSDLAITYPNDSLLRIAPNLPIMNAFGVMDAIMMMPPEEIEKVVTVEDLPILRAMFLPGKHARLGIGAGKGESRELIAVQEAFASPWFDFDLGGVGAALVIVSCADPDQRMLDRILDDVALRVPNARIGCAGRTDPSLGDKVRVTVLLGRPADVL